MTLLHMFGVPAVTEEVYGALLERPRAGLAELAERLGLSTDELGGHIARLSELTLIEAADDRETYVALPPEQSVERLIAAEEARLALLHQQVQETRRRVDGLVDAFVHGRTRRDELGVAERIDDPAVVTSRLFQLVRGARRHVAFILPGKPPPAESLAASARLDADLLDRGIPLRTVVADASLDAGHWRAHIGAQLGRGVQVRSHPAPPTRAIIFDETTAVLPRTGSAGALILHGDDVVAPLSVLFDLTWRESVPVTAEEPACGEAFSEARVRHVVTLLAQGDKDETIARKLAVSVRTVRRLISMALAELQADSRFQAGVLASRQGWVD